MKKLKVCLKNGMIVKTEGDCDDLFEALKDVNENAKTGFLFFTISKTIVNINEIAYIEEIVENEDTK